MNKFLVQGLRARYGVITLVVIYLLLLQFDRVLFAQDTTKSNETQIYLLIAYKGKVKLSFQNAKTKENMVILQLNKLISKKYFDFLVSVAASKVDQYLMIYSSELIQRKLSFLMFLESLVIDFNTSGMPAIFESLKTQGSEVWTPKNLYNLLDFIKSNNLKMFINQNIMIGCVYCREEIVPLNIRNQSFSIFFAGELYDSALFFIFNQPPYDDFLNQLLVINNPTAAPTSKKFSNDPIPIDTTSSNHAMNDNNHTKTIFTNDIMNSDDKNSQQQSKSSYSNSEKILLRTASQINDITMSSNSNKNSNNLPTVSIYFSIGNALFSLFFIIIAFLLFSKTNKNYIRFTRNLTTLLSQYHRDTIQANHNTTRLLVDRYSNNIKIANEKIDNFLNSMTTPANTWYLK